MKEIILEKRYPHSREEDITDAFMRGYEIGKEQEHRWWSAFCANCKDENNSEKPNNCEPTWEQVKEYCNRRCLDIVDSAMRKQWYKDEPQTEEGTIQGTGDCEHCSRLFVDCDGR